MIDKQKCLAISCSHAYICDKVLDKSGICPYYEEMRYDTDWSLNENPYSKYVRCGHCGYVKILREYKFCPNCGSKRVRGIRR